MVPNEEQRKDHIENIHKKEIKNIRLYLMRTVQTSMWETVEGHERSLEYMERPFG